MTKITLNIELVETILKNLKDRLINNIKVSKRKYTQKNKDLEKELIPKEISKSKYLSTNEFKQKLNKR